MPRANRQYAREANRSPNGRLLRADPLARFASKCAFDPTTGCVMWIGTTTHGQGRTQPYGYFWYEGKMHLAHRWAAKHIHKMDIDDLEVDHCCWCGPSTLCVQHLAGETGEANRMLRHVRQSRPAVQTAETRRYWLFVRLGIEQPKRPERVSGGIPYFLPPEWLRPFLLQKGNADDCPF